MHHEAGGNQTESEPPRPVQIEKDGRGCRIHPHGGNFSQEQKRAVFLSGGAPRHKKSKFRCYCQHCRNRSPAGIAKCSTWNILPEYQNSPRGCTRGLVSCELFHVEHFSSITKTKNICAELSQNDCWRLRYVVKYKSSKGTARKNRRSRENANNP